MPRLIVMRHAKAVDRLEAEDDFERGLTERGREDAARAAAAMKSAGLTADQALVSPARRTRETWAVVSETLGAPPVHDPMALYHASTEMLERAASELIARGAQTVAVIGHNPGIGGLAHSLAASAQAATGMPRGWPTSSVGVFDVALKDGALTASARVLLFDPKAG
ncbi:MAG: histidine phosphatase family protein [Oceanicaulis sp.]